MGNAFSCTSNPDKKDKKKKKQAPSEKKKFSDLKTENEAATENGSQKVTQSSQPKTDINSDVQHQDQSDVAVDKPTDTQQEEQTEEPHEQEPQVQQQPDEEDETASVEQSSEHGNSESNKPAVTEFGEEGESQGEFKMAKGLAVFLYGDIAVTEHALGRVYLFGKDGVYKHTVGSTQDGNREAKLLYPTDVAFTPLGHIAVADQTRFVKIFNLDGEFLHRFNIKGDDEDEDVKPKAYSIEVTSDEQILVGDIRRKVITIIKEADASCEWIRKIKLNIEPHFLATNMTNGRHQALACDWKAGEVNAIDIEEESNTDNVIFKLDSFQVDGKPGLPKGLACDEDNHIYISVSRVDDTAEEGKKNVFIGTGHIHQYSCDGEFQRCLTKGLFHPRGLTWHNGSLYVANSHSVVILNTARDFSN